MDAQDLAEETRANEAANILSVTRVMGLEPLSCNNCGAPLEVPPTANYVTCAHCGSRLAVKRTETARYTEVLERLDNLDTRTQGMEAEVARLRIDDAIRNLDQAWESERRQYLVRSRGGPVEPSLARVALFASAALGILGMGFYLTLGISGPFGPGGEAPCTALIILLIAGSTGWLAIGEYLRYKPYVAAESAYLARRNELVNEGWQSQGRQLPAGEMRGVEREAGTDRE